ncbi:uncharacterized protein [Brachionichthys hirsutus]
MRPSVPQVLKPALPVIASVSVESLLSHESKPWPKAPLRDSSNGSSGQSSGIQTNSSCQSYATTEPADIIAGVQEALGKAFPNISPVSPLTTNPLLDLDSGLLSSPSTLCDWNCGLYDIDNKTYSIFNIPRQRMSCSPAVQTQAEMLCDSAYHPSRGDAYQPVPACPLVNVPPAASSALPVDMSYQQCNAGPGRVSNMEDSPLSSGAHKPEPCDSPSRGEAGCDSSDTFAGGTGKLNICDEDPCCNLVPAGSQCFPSIDDAYKPFHILVKQPDGLFSGMRRREEEKPVNKYPEDLVTGMRQTSFGPVVTGLTNNAEQSQSLLELQRPLPASMTVDSSYKIV